MELGADDAREPEALVMELGSMVDEVMHAAEVFLLDASVARINLSRLILLLGVLESQMHEELEGIRVVDEAQRALILRKAPINDESSLTLHRHRSVGVFLEIGDLHVELVVLDPFAVLRENVFAQRLILRLRVLHLNVISFVLLEIVQSFRVKAANEANENFKLTLVELVVMYQREEIAEEFRAHEAAELQVFVIVALDEMVDQGAFVQSAVLDITVEAPEGPRSRSVMLRDVISQSHYVRELNFAHGAHEKISPPQGTQSLGFRELL